MIIFAVYLAINKVPCLYHYYHDIFMQSDKLFVVSVVVTISLGMFMLFSKNGIFRKLLCLEATSFFIENFLSTCPNASLLWAIAFGFLVNFIEKFTKPINIEQRNKKC